MHISLDQFTVEFDKREMKALVCCLQTIINHGVSDQDCEKKISALNVADARGLLDSLSQARISI